MKRSFVLAVLTLVLGIAGFGQGLSKATATPTPAASTTETEKKPARFTPNKDQIMQGQKLLKDKKLYTGEADGKYNDDTRAAIRAYQKENGLTLSGNFNQATLEKMNIALTDKQKGASTGTTAAATDASSSKKAKTAATASASDASAAEAKTDSTTTEAKSAATADGPKRPAPFQANKDQITALQTKLKDAKLFTGAADGERSDALKESVKKYQEANGLKATGGINAATLEKAGIALTDKQKEQVAAQAAYDAAKTPKN
ncbi:hypothetical protein BH10ACI3_BH10ACI3_20890 [soil metagenome]